MDDGTTLGWLGGLETTTTKKKTINAYPKREKINVITGTKKNNTKTNCRTFGGDNISINLCYYLNLLYLN
jgi:hypothetical protein